MKKVYEIIDSHIHYWEAPSVDRPWTKGAHLPDSQPLSVEQILATADEAGVDRVVQVVPSMMGYDNRYAFEGAQAHPDRVVGVFARVDPHAPDMVAQLTALRKLPKFLGIRLAMLTPAQQTWLSGPALGSLFEEAARHDFPIAIYARGLPKAIGELARRHPETRILVDHMALNATIKQPFEDWPEVLSLVRFPNLWIKVSYFPEASHQEEYPYMKGQQYLREMVETFGADRLIWGSNFPPSIRACGYRQSLEFMREACSFLPESEQAKIFSLSFLKACSLA